MWGLAGIGGESTIRDNFKLLCLNDVKKMMSPLTDTEKFEESMIEGKNNKRE